MTQQRHLAPVPGPRLATCTKKTEIILQVYVMSFLGDMICFINLFGLWKHNEGVIFE